MNVKEFLSQKKNDDCVTVKTIPFDSHNIYVLYMPSNTDMTKIQDSILAPLLEWNNPEDKTVDHAFSAEPLTILSKTKDMDSHLLNGYTLMLENETVYAVETCGFHYRAVSEPVSEMTLRGARDGFIESLEENIKLLRVHLRSTHLKFEHLSLGLKAFTHVTIAYVEDEANEKLLEEVRKRIKAVKEDYLPDGGVVEQSLEKNTFSLFPELQETERPAKVANALAEGKVAIFVEGSPSVLLAPVTLNSLFQTSDDYNFKWIPASLIRLMRFAAAFLAVMLPSIYISLISFHHGLIPTDLAISISKTREGVPIPSFMEAFIMQMTIEILREAGIRLPKPIGPAVSIVGAIVIGEAAVTAGIVSPLMIIVVAFAAICSFTIVDYSLSLALRTVSFIMLFAAAMLGIYGLILAVFILSIHLIRLNSFTVPYLEPFAPYYPSRWKDTLIRLRFDKEGGSDE
ncbi:spore germination protein [Halobacillus sp. Cin3]|uniref:spore germination protein n=1 Tax=Halobacillus sp. Cin3 TaxID=2928441 RepID=UPI00248F0D6B|nr:spore germination protein [Halobacillus sp. Cin3]